MTTTRETIDIGDHVECDDCSKEYTAADGITGGLLFQSKAIGPCCADGWEASAIRHDEQRFIRDRCPAGVSFHAWVMKLRGGNNTITITRVDP